MKQMLIPRDDQERRYPKCNGLIPANADCVRCAENPDSVDGSKHNPESQLIADMMKCFLMSEKEAELMKSRIIGDIELLLPQFLKRTTLTTLLRLIQRRAEAYFVANRVPRCDAEDLAATLILKVHGATSQKWPHGNLGSWITMIRTNLMRDYWRKKGVEERSFGYRVGAGALKGVHKMDEPSRRLFVEEFEPSHREIVERLLDGDKWQEIAASYSKKAKELRKTLDSMEWDGESAPLRKRCRRRRPES